MKNRLGLYRVLALVGLLLYLGPGLPVAQAQVAPSQVTTYDFESTLSPWSAAADTNTTAGFAQSTRNNACPGNGAASAELTITSTLTAPAGAWMWSTFTSTVTSTVVLTWSAISGLACVGCTPIAYIGSSAPTASTQFKQLTPTLTGSWQSYTYSATAGGNPVDVALGFRDTAILLVYPKAVDFDCIDVDIH